MLAVLRANGVETVLVSEEELEEAFRFLYARAKLACEPAAAVGASPASVTVRPERRIILRTRAASIMRGERSMPVMWRNPRNV